MTRFITLFVLLSGLVTSLRAQSLEPSGLPTIPPPRVPLHFDHLTNNDGLSQTSVYSILQDRNGFMWFGTQDGLNKYDGYKFTVYANDPDDVNSMNRGWIMSLHEDQNGELWIVTSGPGADRGLARFDPLTETFTRYSHDPDDPNSLSDNDVQSLIQDRQGHLWIGTDNGLNRFDPTTETFTRYSHDPDDPNSLSHNTVLSLVQDRHGNIWIGTNNGLNRFDPSTETFTRYNHDPNDPQTLSDNRVLYVYEDSRGNIWAGCGSIWPSQRPGGLNRLDPETGRITRFLHDPGDPTSLGHNNIRAIFEDRDGTLWVGAGYVIGAMGSGLNRFDPVTETFVRYRHDPNHQGTIGSNSVHSIYQDRQGLLWVGTGLGVSRTDPVGQRFERYDWSILEVESIFPRAIYEDQSGVLWIGSSAGGVIAYNRTTGEVSHYRHDPDDPRSAPFVEIRSITEDQLGRIWMPGEGRSLARLDRTTGLFTYYQHDSTNPDSPGPGVRRVIRDLKGRIWIGHDEGMDRYDIENNRFIHYTHSPDDSTTLASGRAVPIFLDDEGMIWIGQQGLVTRFDPETGTAIRYPFEQGGWHMQMRKQEPGILWIATNGSGLYRFDTQTGETKHYTMQNSGLSNNTVYGVLPDDDGTLWLSTNNGLNRFNPDTDEWRVFHTADGLQSNEFNIFSYFKSPEGELFFGGINGVTSFFPDQLKDNSTPPQVAITDFKLFNQSVEWGEDSPLKQSITATDRVTLDHHQNDLSFDYVGLHYQQPEKNTYAYRLRGYNDQWQEVGTLRTVSFTNLRPGDYVFQVKAANADGVWNEEGRSLSITILPPWWRTTWAYILYGLMLIAGVVAADRIQRRRLIARERERARERELEQARKLEIAHTELQQAHEHLKATQAQLVHQEKLASLGELTAGIAHEIKNPLNFINNFAEMVGELADELDDEVASTVDDSGADSTHQFKEILSDLKLNAEQIAKHGRRADGIVSAMMQHASGGTGRREPTDVNALLEEYVNLAYHGKRAKIEGFSCEIEQAYDAAVGKVEMIPQDIGRVFLNLLSNAFDAVAEQDQPTVRVQTERMDNAIAIRVTDNGPGISENLQQKIFMPFFTTKPTGSGTGLGLSMSHDIVVQGHGGTLTVESTEGEGATFIVTMLA